MTGKYHSGFHEFFFEILVKILLLCNISNQTLHFDEKKNVILRSISYSFTIFQYLIKSLEEWTKKRSRLQRFDGIGICQHFPPAFWRDFWFNGIANRISRVLSTFVTFWDFIKYIHQYSSFVARARNGREFFTILLDTSTLT